MLAVFVVFVLAVSVFVYFASFAKTKILTSVSDNGGYHLTVYMIGAPEWPFGATHCRFDLFHGGKRLIKHPFSIQDDGAAAHEDNFYIAWDEGHVTVIVSGSEQSDQAYVLNFDGTVE